MQMVLAGSRLKTEGSPVYIVNPFMRRHVFGDSTLGIGRGGSRTTALGSSACDSECLSVCEQSTLYLGQSIQRETRRLMKRRWEEFGVVASEIRMRQLHAHTSAPNSVSAEDGFLACSRPAVSCAMMQSR